jgi:hypothetical protein
MTRLLPLLPLFALIACDDADVPVACAAYAALALQVDVTDADGNSLPGATVSFTIEDGARQEASCLDADEPASCTSFATAYEQAGTYDVLVEYTVPTADPCCWHADAKTATVTVGADECHVIGEQITVAIDTSIVACADACG